MSLTTKEIDQISQLLQDSAFDELHLELDGMKLSLRRAGAGFSEQRREPTPSTPAAPMLSPPAPAPTSTTPNPPPAAITLDPNQEPVTAPLLGTFYRAPKPGAAAFVEVGSEVDVDTVVGIIEVMKLMNTVRAGCKGRVTAIHARDGVLVEYGETLLTVARIS